MKFECKNLVHTALTRKALLGTVCTVFLLTGCTLTAYTTDAPETLTSLMQKLESVEISDVIVTQEDAADSYATTATSAFLKYLGDAYSTRCTVYNTTDGLSTALKTKQTVTYSVTESGKYVKPNPYQKETGEKSFNLGEHYYLEYAGKWYFCTDILIQKEAVECTRPEADTTFYTLLNVVCTPENYRKNIIESSLAVDIKSIDTFVYNGEVYVYTYDGYGKLKQIINATTGEVYTFDVWYAPEDVATLIQECVQNNK